MDVEDASRFGRPVEINHDENEVLLEFNHDIEALRLHLFLTSMFGTFTVMNKMRINVCEILPGPSCYRREKVGSLRVRRAQSDMEMQQYAAKASSEENLIFPKRVMLFLISQQLIRTSKIQRA